MADPTCGDLGDAVRKIAKVHPHSTGRAHHGIGSVRKVVRQRPRVSAPKSAEPGDGGSCLSTPNKLAALKAPLAGSPLSLLATPINVLTSGNSALAGAAGAGALGAAAWGLTSLTGNTLASNDPGTDNGPLQAPSVPSLPGAIPLISPSVPLGGGSGSGSGTPGSGSGSNGGGTTNGTGGGTGSGGGSGGGSGSGSGGGSGGGGSKTPTDGGKPTSVPEPSSILIFAVAAILLLVLRPAMRARAAVSR